MISLYNIYKSLILESVKIDAINDAINNHYTVNITYDNGKGDGTENVKRYCQVYSLGKTKNMNDAIRVYQFYGPNQYKWKTFRVDRIVNWEPTKWKYYRPISSEKGSTAPKYKEHQDLTLGGGNTTFSKFDDKYRI